MTITEPTTKPDWYRSRSYAHFDRPLSAERASILVSSPTNVARHSFWPLILNPRLVHSYKDDGTGHRRPHKKLRPIGYAAHSDSHIFAYYARLLLQRLEDRYLREGGEHVLAYRTFDPPQCNVHFASAAFQELRDRAPRDFIAVDVEGFFDSLSHDILKTAWQDLLGVERLPEDHYAVFRACTRDYAIKLSVLRDALGGEVRRRAGKQGCAICSPADFRRKIAPLLRPRYALVSEIKKKQTPASLASKWVGIPQGLPISAVLANLYMLETDKRIVRRISEIDGTYRRYSDDILLIIKPSTSDMAEEILREELGIIRLSVNPSKTDRCRLRMDANSLSCFRLDEEGHELSRTTASYLGLSFDGSKVMIRPSTTSQFQMKAKRAIDRAEKAALRRGESKIRRRKLYARLTTLGYGSAFGLAARRGQRPPGAPRLGFFKYLALAIRLTNSEDIKKQQRQLKNQVYRWINEADKRLAQKT